MRLVCSDCGEPWYMSLTECFICGSINPFLYHCDKCGAYVSITNAGKKCNKCDEEGSLHLECPNKDCLTNTNTELKTDINLRGGSFHKHGGFLISCQYCLKCGSQLHEYILYKFYIKAINNTIVDFKAINFDSIDILKNNTIIIFRLEKDEKVLYSAMQLIEIISEIGKEIKLNDFYENFNDLVSDLFYKTKTKKS